MPLNEKDLTRIERLAASLVVNLMAEHPEYYKDDSSMEAQLAALTERLGNAMKQAIEAEVEAFRQELAG